MATYAERLQKVQDAIDDILLNGQSFRYGERQLTAADLGQLRLMEADYAAKAGAAASAAKGGGRLGVTYVTPV